MKPGDSLPEIKVTPDYYLTERYAGASGDHNPIHVDEEFARGVGLPGRILHGLWTMAQVARACTEAAGGPQTLERLSVKFRAMGVLERPISVMGVVDDVREDGTATAHLNVEQDGKAIVRGAEAELRLG